MENLLKKLDLFKVGCPAGKTVVNLKPRCNQLTAGIKRATLDKTIL
jgi:hypothetical protein